MPSPSAAVSEILKETDMDAATAARLLAPFTPNAGTTKVAVSRLPNTTLDSGVFLDNSWQPWGITYGNGEPKNGDLVQNFILFQDILFIRVVPEANDQVKSMTLFLP
jgi:hypothetical protein